MEEDNKITPWQFIIQHWKLIALVFLLFPIIINALTFIPNFQVFDKPNSWTEVWAEYGGALLSAGIALVILYKQQKQNERQNKFNRKLQINALKYQQKNNWYIQLKCELTNLTRAWDIQFINDIAAKIAEFYLEKNTDKETIDKLASSLENDINKKRSELDIALMSCKYLFPQCYLDDEEKGLWEEIDMIEAYFLDVLNDLKWIILSLPHPNVKRMSSAEIEKLCFKENKKGIYKEIYIKLEDEQFDFYNNVNKIIFSVYEEFESEINECNFPVFMLLQYEQEKIDKLLEIENENK